MFHHFFKVFNAVVHLEMNPIAMKREICRIVKTLLKDGVYFRKKQDIHMYMQPKV